MCEKINEPSNTCNDLGARPDRECFSDCFAAYRKACYKRRHQKRYHLRPGKRKTLQHLRSNRGRSRAGHNAANITHNIVADRTDPLCVPQETNRFLTTRHFSGSHRMKRSFVRRCYGNTDYVKNNAQHHNGQQN